MVLSRLQDPATAGSIVRRIREERGLSRAALSSATGVAPRTLYSLEAGESENFGLGNLIKVFGALGLTLCVDDGRGTTATPGASGVLGTTAAPCTYATRGTTAMPDTPEPQRAAPAGAWEALPDIWRLDEEGTS